MLAVGVFFAAHRGEKGASSGKPAGPLGQSAGAATDSTMASWSGFTPGPTDKAELLQAIEHGWSHFHDYACWRCHTLGGAELPGSQDIDNLGPDLASVGRRLAAEKILQSILKPNAEIAEPVADHTHADGTSRMPAFGDGIPGDHVRDLVIFLSNNGSKTAGGSDGGSDGGTIVVTEENFDREARRAKSLVLLDFWAQSCLACLELEPVLEKIAAEFHGRVRICRIDTEENPALTAEFLPDNILPGLVLLKDGKLIDRHYGTDPDMAPQVFLRKWLSENLDPGLEDG